MFLQLFLYLMQLSWLSTLTGAASPPLEGPFFKAKTGCESKCGNISVPYPFGLLQNGINVGCSFGGSSFAYSITCNTSFNPPKLFQGTGDVEIIDISETEFRTKNTPSILCYNASGGLTLDESYSQVDFSRTPFTFSYTRNMFFTIGCNVFSTLRGPDVQNYTSQCQSTCESKESVRSGSCLGNKGCCQSTIPKGLKRFQIGVLPNSNQSHVSWSFDPCNYAFVGQQSQYTFQASDILNGDSFVSKGKDVPLVLDWAIGNKTCEEAQNDVSGLACQANSRCINHDNSPGYICTCNEGYEGNPYLSPGCQDVNECDDLSRNVCVENCTNTIGSYFCSCPKGSRGDGRKGGSGCTRDNQDAPVLQISLGIGIGFLFLILSGSWLYLSMKKRNSIKLKRKCFQKNGGLLLRQQIHENGGVQSSAKIFTAQELQLATKNYDARLVLGRGGHGIVYKGTLADNRSVAIKKSTVVKESQIEEFINELVILTQVNHRNVVKILGCCLETEVPLIVYEYVSNGTLSDHIHSKDGINSSSLSWDSRLRIATETAGALSYLHSAATVPIIHRDIKSANILLDDNYTAKVADFGASRLNPLDLAEIDTVVQGTLGYLDPEYHESGQLTGKSDVYSFGVVLVELLTGERPISLARPERKQNFPVYFHSLVTENDVLEILEARVATEGIRDQVLAVANLAKRCLSLRGDDRPTMKQVAMELESMRRFKAAPARSQSHEEATSTETEPTDLYAVPSSFSDVGDSSLFSADTAMSMDIPR